MYANALAYLGSRKGEASGWGGGASIVIHATM